MQLTTRRESSIVRLFLRVETSIGTLVRTISSWIRTTNSFMFGISSPYDLNAVRKKYIQLFLPKDKYKLIL
jgi:hypothetical protein